MNCQTVSKKNSSITLHFYCFLRNINPNHVDHCRQFVSGHRQCMAFFRLSIVYSLSAPIFVLASDAHKKLIDDIGRTYVHVFPDFNVLPAN